MVHIAVTERYFKIAKAADKLRSQRESHAIPGSEFKQLCQYSNRSCGAQPKNEDFNSSRSEKFLQLHNPDQLWGPTDLISNAVDDPSPWLQ
jgi:hypothetical protein